MEQLEVKIGVYEHYQGGRYVVVGLATDKSQTPINEKVVVYHPIDSVELYYRPVSEFLALVRVAGKEIERFRYIRD